MRIISCFVVSMLITTSLFSQFIEIEGVKGRRFTGVKAIVSGEDAEVEGYYTYYMKERAEKGMRTFEFALIDKELKTDVRTELTLHKYANINTIVFNGQFLLISWDERKNKKIVVNLIDRQGKIVLTKDYPMEKKWLTASTIYADNSGEGFYIVTKAVRKNTYGYSIEKINNKLEQVWKTDEIPDKGNKKIADLINNKDRFVVWEEYSPQGKKIKPQIVCFDAKSGKKIFTKDGYDGVSTLLYNQLRIDKDFNIYVGGPYVDGIKYKAVNNTGIYMMKLDPNGKEILYAKVNNEEKIQAALKTTSKGFTLGSKDKVFVEDLIIDGDQIIVIAEMFRKNMNMTPRNIQLARDLITGKFVGYPNNNDKSKVVFDIMDFILFKFDQDGKLGEIKAISKESYNKITCWQPYSHMPGLVLAKSLSDRGWFDYGFTAKDVNGKKIMVCKNNSSPRKPEVYMYTLDESYAQKKINLRQQGKMDLEKARVGYFNILRAQEGKVAVVYFQRKLKKISLSMESLH